MPEHEDADEEKNYKGGSAADVGRFTYRASVSVYRSRGAWFLTVSMMTQQPDFDGKWSITGFSSLMVNGQQISAQSAALPSGSYFSDAEWNYVGSSTYPLGNITGGKCNIKYWWWLGY